MQAVAAHVLAQSARIRDGLRKGPCSGPKEVLRFKFHNLMGQRFNTQESGSHKAEGSRREVPSHAADLDPDTGRVRDRAGLARAGRG